MNKRLRKKLRLGEFDSLLIPIAFRLAVHSSKQRNDLLDDFLEHAIESNGLQFGGGGSEDLWSGFAEPGLKILKITESQRSSVEHWLASIPDIEEYYVGPIHRDSEILSITTEDPDYPESQLSKVKQTEQKQ